MRVPASYCGVYGFKVHIALAALPTCSRTRPKTNNCCPPPTYTQPTYGVLSRHGLVAYASSLDCPGLFARSLEDLTLMLGMRASRFCYAVRILEAHYRRLLVVLVDR